MATRKKKSEVTEAMLEPVIVQGTHLTVTTWPDGRTELKWDDDQLLREVQNAILKYESTVPAVENKPAVRVRSSRKKK